MYKRIRNITILCLFICAVTVLNSCINLNLNLNSGKNPGKTVITSTAVGDVSVNDKTSFMRNYLLSEEEKLVYDIVYSGMKNKQTTIKFSSLEGYFASESEMKKILSNAVFSVLRDHPELFMYNSGYTYEYNTEFEADSVALKFDFNTEPEKAILMQQQIDKVVNKLIEEMRGLDDYGKSKYVYTYLAQNTTYSDGENMHNMYGPLVDGVSKCDGYARAYMYIMQKCGIEVGYVCGVGKDELHAWNTVKINGNWYYVDCTWGDPIVEIEDETEKKLNVDYSYLHINTEDLLKTHTLDEIYLKLPKYTATADNYHVKEAFCFEAFDEAVLEKTIKDLIKNADSDNTEFKLEIKYNTYEEMQKAFDWIAGDNMKKVASLINYSSFYYTKWQSDIGALSLKFVFEF